MAQTTNYEQNEVIFKAGDKAESMFILRKGTVKIFLEKDNTEITLAVLQQGAVFGEMAFFDDQPRSAGARCVESSELTQVSKQDFNRLLMQIPKWLHTMMNALSMRLRTTNDRLKDVEAKLIASSGAGGQKSIAVLPNQSHPFQLALNALKLMTLVYLKEGEKLDNEMIIKYEAVKEYWDEFFPSSKDYLEPIVRSASKTNFITSRVGDDGVYIITIPNKNALAHFTTHGTRIAQKLDYVHPSFSTLTIQIFQEILKIGEETLKDEVQLSLQGVLEHLKKGGKNVENWGKHLESIGKIPEVKMTQNGADTLIHLNVKEHKTILTYIRYLKKFYDDGLA